MTATYQQVQKAIKLKALAERGIGGEKTKAKKILINYMIKYNIGFNQIGGKLKEEPKPNDMCLHCRYKEGSFCGYNKKEIDNNYSYCAAKWLTDEGWISYGFEYSENDKKWIRIQSLVTKNQ